MTQWLLLGGTAVWLLALAWVLQDAYAHFPRAAQVWWGAITLVLGPFAVPLYLSERLTRRAEFNKIGHGKAAFSAPEGKRPFRDGRQHRFTDVPGAGSGFFVSADEGARGHQRVEIPAHGALIIRRGVPGESSRPGVMVLHDLAVSRDEHCRLWTVNGRVMLADRSRWGTTVGDERVQGATVDIASGMRFRIGQTVFEVQQGGS
jgi:hypothetical protein